MRYHTDHRSDEKIIAKLEQCIADLSIPKPHMNFTTRQLQIIAHSLALHENDDMFKGNVEGEMQDILSHLQERGIWGYIDDVQGR